MCNGGPKPAGSSASSSENAPSVSSAAAFTDTLNPPRSIALPSSGRRTKAFPTFSVIVLLRLLEITPSLDQCWLDGGGCPEHARCQMPGQGGFLHIGYTGRKRTR